MTDKEILEEVYRKLDGAAMTAEQFGDAVAIRRFIEQEWQKADEQEQEDGKKWYTDVRDIERHRGLKIGPDGTVTEVK